MERLKVMTWRQIGKPIRQQETLSGILVHLHICIFVRLALMSIFHMLLLFSHHSKDKLVSALVMHVL